MPRTNDDGGGTSEPDELATFDTPCSVGSLDNSSVDEGFGGFSGPAADDAPGINMPWRLTDEVCCHCASDDLGMEKRERKSSRGSARAAAMCAEWRAVGLAPLVVADADNAASGEDEGLRTSSVELEEPDDSVEFEELEEPDDDEIAVTRAFCLPSLATFDASFDGGGFARFVQLDEVDDNTSALIGETTVAGPFVLCCFAALKSPRVGCPLRLVFFKPKSSDLKSLVVGKGEFSSACMQAANKTTAFNHMPSSVIPKHKACRS